MFRTLKTLVAGSNACAEERVRDMYSIELIDQKIREAGDALKSAKYGLASLIQRERAETRQITSLEGRVADLMERAADALKGERADLAQEAAQAVADMENELTIRRETVCRLETRVLQLRQSVEAANRRILDLKQGAVAARAMRREQGIQKKLLHHSGGECAMDEAENLIARVMQQDDPFEQNEILRQIDNGLQNEDVADRMAEAGFGASSKLTANDVMSRLKV